MFVLVRACKESRILEHCEWRLNTGKCANATQNGGSIYWVNFGTNSSSTVLFPLGYAVLLLPNSQKDDESLHLLVSYRTNAMHCKVQKTSRVLAYSVTAPAAFANAPFQTALKKFRDLRFCCCLLIWQTQILDYKEKCNATLQYTEPIAWRNTFCLISYLL